MPKSPEPKPGPGFCPGKRVWLADTFDGARLARQFGEYNRDLTVADGTMDEYGQIPVRLGDGTVVRIAVRHLRLRPSVERAAPKLKPVVRKEAIAPEKGTETTIFDFLEA